MANDDMYSCTCKAGTVIENFTSMGVRWVAMRCPKCGRTTRAFSSSRNIHEAEQEARYAWRHGEIRVATKLDDGLEKLRVKKNDMCALLDWMRKRLLERAGIFTETAKSKIGLDKIFEMQWSKNFEQFMRNRMAMGYFRYGALPAQIGRHKFDNIESIKKRLDLYEQTHNREHLVDIANLCLVEFEVNPTYPFFATDDAIHTKEK